MAYFNYINGELHAEAINLSQLADKVNTPFYCYSSAAISDRYQQFCQSFEHIDSLVCYAMKANPNQAVLSILAKQGAGADVVSLGELKRAIAAGIAPDKIVFSGVAKSTEEIRYALSLAIRCFNVESEPELLRISDIAAQMGLSAPVSLRINPDVDAKTHAKITTGKLENKFGIAIDQALAVYQKAQQLPGINVCGIDMHIGSQITQLNAYDDAIKRIVNLYHDLQKIGVDIEHIDLGGGLGVAYQNSDTDAAKLLAQYAQIVNRYASELNCQWIFEPGRFIVADAGVLVTRVSYVKQSVTKNFLIVDAGMNDLIRPTLYDAWHDIQTVKQTGVDSETMLVDVVGPVCESGDYLALDRQLPSMQEGDLLVLRSAGAYAAAMADMYNTRPLISEVLVSGDNSHVIRQSPSYEQIIAMDSVPDWL